MDKVQPEPNPEEKDVVDLEVNILHMWTMIKRLILEEEKLSTLETDHRRAGG